MQDFQRHLDKLKALRTQVLGVSHNEIEKQAKFAEKYGLTFPLLSDPKAEAARPYGTKGFLPFFSRKAFVIDGQGVVRMVIDGMPELNKLLTFLEALTGDLP